MSLLLAGAALVAGSWNWVGEFKSFFFLLLFFSFLFFVFCMFVLSLFCGGDLFRCMFALFYVDVFVTGEDGSR